MHLRGVDLPVLLVLLEAGEAHPELAQPARVRVLVRDLLLERQRERCNEIEGWSEAATVIRV
jgi:hypothetical protein